MCQAFTTWSTWKITLKITTFGNLYQQFNNSESWSALSIGIILPKWLGIFFPLTLFCSWPSSPSKSTESVSKIDKSPTLGIKKQRSISLDIFLSTTCGLLIKYRPFLIWTLRRFLCKKTWNLGSVFFSVILFFYQSLRAFYLSKEIDFPPWCLPG